MLAAARQLRLVHLAKLTETRAIIQSARRVYPDIADEAMSIYTNGASPKYDETPTKAAPDDGYSHCPRNSKIIASMWGDIIGLKELVFASKSWIYSAGSGYIPTTAVPKRLPGRSFSGKSRIASDLRRINLCLNTEDFFTIWLPGIKHIADRPIRTKRQFHVFLPWSASEISVTLLNARLFARIIFRYFAISFPLSQVVWKTTLLAVGMPYPSVCLLPPGFSRCVRR